MRSRPSETVAGVRALLKEAVGPALSSEQASYVLRRILAVLREGDWDDHGFRLLAENEALKALAAEVRAASAGRPLSDEANAALSRWEALAALEGLPRSYEDAARVNASLRNAIAETISALAGSPAAAEIRNLLIRGFLRLAG